ncbi:MAG: efflux RND transporter periplasmic adaptor subunit [Prolixibacteraceae bacterium]|nr:efflux RND transporter periplasmic adaptor subunit [Prolixibacteraceae bacterium]
MVKKLIYIVVALAVIVAAVIRLKANKENARERVYQYDTEKPISVQGIILKFENINNTYYYTGTFEPGTETKVSAEIQGKINKVLVDLGSHVKKGQPLIQLDNSLLKLQLQSVEVQIEGLESDVKRYKVLAEADAIQGIQLEKAELGLKSAKVQLATLLEQISKTEIKAPFDGIVTGKLTEVGAFAAPGMPLLQITDISHLKFTVNVPENELRKFSTGRASQITADVYPDVALSGKVILVGSKANMGNSYPVQLDVENTPDLKVKSGMFGKVEMKSGGDEKQIIIPASAIIGTTIQPQVYTIKKGKAILQDVTIRERFENKAVVSKGLNADDVLITSGFINLFNGANVIIK